MSAPAFAIPSPPHVETAKAALTALNNASGSLIYVVALGEPIDAPSNITALKRASDAMRTAMARMTELIDQATAAMEAKND